MDYPAYPVYRESGVEWLGEIPEHWQVLAIKRFSLIKRGASPRPIDDEKYFDDDGEYAWVRIADVTANKHYLQTTTQRLSNLGKSYSVPLECGQLFLSIAGSVGKPMISKIKCCIHDGFVYFPSLTQEPEFLYYIFESSQPYLGLGKLGTQLNLNTDTVGGINIGLPSIEEQQTIAQFLDHKTQQIDQLIAKKQTLIDKLQEQRVALITYAVTKGLNPDVKMKDSGVEWLGDVPEHWDVVRIKMIAEIRYGLSEPPEYVEDGLCLIRATDVFRGKIDTRQIKKVRVNDIDWKRNIPLSVGEIIIVRSGAYTGDSAIIPKHLEGSVAGFDMVLTAQRANSYFLAYTLLSRYMLEGQIFLSKTRAAQPHLNAEDLGGFNFVSPTLDEQEQIVKYLDAETARIDQMLELNQQTIDKLKEYRTALITTAVTGKIDLRNWQKNKEAT